MSNYNTLKTAIANVIKQNGNNEITGALLQQSLLAIINGLGLGYQFVGIATPETNPGTPDQNVFYIASEVGTYSNFGLSVGENEVAVFLWNGTWSKQSTGAASEEAVNQLGQDVDEKLGVKELSKTITSGATQKIGDVNLKSGDKVVFQLSGTFRAGDLIISADSGLLYQLVHLLPYSQDTEVEVELTQDVTELWVWMQNETLGTFNVTLLWNLNLKVKKNSDAISVITNEIGDIDSEIGYQSVSKTITSGATQKIGDVDLKSGDKVVMSLSGTLSADTIIISGTADFSYQMITISPYNQPTDIELTLQQDIDGLWLYMSNETLGTINVEIYKNLSLRVYKKYTKPSSGIPQTDLEVGVKEAIDLVGFPTENKTFSDDDYNDFVMDINAGEIASVSHSATWNSITIPLTKGMMYILTNAYHAFISSVKPEVGMTISQFDEVIPATKIYVDDDSQKYLLVTINSEGSALLVVYFKYGYNSITEFDKIGICLGDSNMQATGITVGEGEDPGTLMGRIMGANVMNGGIGGTTFSDINSLISFDKIAEALVSRDFTDVDSGIADIISLYPTWTFLQTRYAAIKQTPLSNVDFIFIAYGTNDWNLGRTIDNANNKYDVTTILGALRYGVKILLEENPKLRMYVATPAYRYGMNDDDDNDSDNYTINGKYLYEIGNAIFDACKELHIPCLNYYYTSGSNTYNRSAILNGGTHRTQYGYELMAKQYCKFMLSY